MPDYIEDVLKGDVITGTYHYAHGLRAVDLFKSIVGVWKCTTGTKSANRYIRFSKT